MKLTTPESIQENEKEFIDTINAELDWDAIEQLLFDKHGFILQDEVAYRNGDLVVHDNQIAYKFDFEVKVPLSVIFNRRGECVDLSTQGNDGAAFASMGMDESVPEPHAVAEPARELPGERAPEISEIAGMISEINGGDNR